MTTASTSTPRPSSPGAVATPGGAAASAAPGTGSHTAASSTPAACSAAAMCRRPIRPAPATARRIGLERSKRVAYAVMPIRVASAPCSYGVFEITADRPGLPDGEELARVMAETGFVGTELGPPGYFGQGPEVGQMLAAHGLELMGSFLPLRFSRPGGFEEDLAAMESALDTLDAAAAGGGRPFVLLADAFLEPDRLRHAGDIEAHPETWL